MAVIHGGTDAGPTPRIDLSTNANPYGPSPVAKAAMDTPIAAYPDPTYTRTRAAIAAHTGFPVEEIVVGAGATELIYRLVFCRQGPVAAPVPGFGEYAGAAAIHGSPFSPLPATPEDGAFALPTAGVAFITNPGSPDGQMRTTAWVHTLQSQAEDAKTWLVWDLAYHNLLTPTITPSTYPLKITDYPPEAILLFAPNKAHGCTGLRAGWLRAPAPIATRLRAAQMSWIVSTPGAAFLEAQASTGADEWVETTNLRMHATALRLASTLDDLGWMVQKGHSAWLIAKPPHPRIVDQLRTNHGIKVRDLTSQGVPGWVRVGTPHDRDFNEVSDAVSAVTTSP